MSKEYEPPNHVAAKKEIALEQAIDYHFRAMDWDESVLEEMAGFNIAEDGSETFFIGKVDLVLFSPLDVNTVIENNRVTVEHQQTITRLYSV